MEKVEVPPPPPGAALPAPEGDLPVSGRGDWMLADPKRRRLSVSEDALHAFTVAEME